MMQFDEVSFEYTAGETIIERLSFRVEPGEVLGLFGPSGCGKSTILYLAGLMLTPSSGRIMLDAQDIGGLPDRERSELRRTTIGFVFQDGCLDSTRSILDNVIEVTAYSGQDRRRAAGDARDLLQRLGVEVDPRRKPVAISGGQAQRVAVCRALLPRPKVLLADEPTGNLDDASAARVIDELATAAASGMSVVVATHDPRVASRCDERMDVGA